jgi:hypothetical protein
MQPYIARCSLCENTRPINRALADGLRGSPTHVAAHCLQTYRIEFEIVVWLERLFGYYWSYMNMHVESLLKGCRLLTHGTTLSIEFATEHCIAHGSIVVYLLRFHSDQREMKAGVDCGALV